MTDTKRIKELKAGDRVILPYVKGPSTILEIEKINEWEYEIFCKEYCNSFTYGECVEVSYLGSNKKEEKTMKTQKVDCSSALYPYFDSLASEEATLKHTNVPVYVRQQLKNIHELFEDVLGLTLEEMKTLYFERKMSKSDEKTTPLVNRQVLRSKIFYNGYELNVTTRLFILKESYELDSESVPDSSTTYCGNCEEIGFKVYLSTSTGNLVNRFKNAVDVYILSKHPDTLM